MEFFKMFANLPDLPAVLAADDAEIGSLGLLVQCMCYCTSSGEPGFVPDGKMSRFGGARLQERIAALAAEGLLIRGDRGWHINPEAWCEERNLNDAAERKREADRNRMRANRAAKRDESRDKVAPAPGKESRDSRATGRATPSRDSRALEVEVDKTSPPTPQRHRRPAAPPSPPLLNLAATGEGEGDQSQRETQAQLIAEVRSIRPDWSSVSIRRALEVDAVAERPPRLVRDAILAVARDPASKAPGRLAHDGPWWWQDTGGSATGLPEKCEFCGPSRRMEDPTTGDDLGPCPQCHPSAVRPAAVAAS